MAKRASEAVDKPLTAACRVVLLCGKEYFLRTLYTQRLRDLLAKEFGEIDALNFDGSNCSAADVLDECRSFGLIAQHKLVAVDNAADLVKEEVRTMFENYCKSPSEGATLVLRSDTWRPGNLDKIIESVGVIKACEPLSDSMAMGWAQKRVAERYDAKIDGSAVQLLISRIGTDLSKIDTSWRNWPWLPEPERRSRRSLCRSSSGFRAKRKSGAFSEHCSAATRRNHCNIFATSWMCRASRRCA